MAPARDDTFYERLLTLTSSISRRRRTRLDTRLIHWIRAWIVSSIFPIAPWLSSVCLFPSRRTSSSPTPRTIKYRVSREGEKCTVWQSSIATVLKHSRNYGALITSKPLRAGISARRCEAPRAGRNLLRRNYSSHSIHSRSMMMIIPATFDPVTLGDFSLLTAKVALELLKWAV